MIELLIVVTIIGLLATIVVPNLLSAIQKARQVATSVLLKAYGTALDVYKVDNNVYPSASTIAEVQPLLLPYSEPLRLKDDWHTYLGYAMSGTTYSVESYGADGIDGANITPETRFIYTLDIVFSTGQFSASIE